MVTRWVGLAVLALAGVGCGILGPSREAPDACGFPRGTPLVFAGRSTTATLQVQEVVGDPMSNDLADIYVTRDEVDQGAIRGQLVCAIYVDTPGFVELTVAPEGWDLETGRPPPEAIQEPQPPEVPEAPATGIARASHHRGT